MAKFIGDIEAAFTPGDKRVRLEDSFAFISDRYRTFICVDKGFETDFASVPKFLHWFIGPTDTNIREAAVVHDFIYSRLTDRFTRKEADNILVEGMEVLGASAFKRKAVYAAVRMFGAGHWGKRAITDSRDDSQN